MTTPVIRATLNRNVIALHGVDAVMAPSSQEDEKLSFMDLAIIIGGTLLTLAACGAMNEAVALLVC